LDGTVSISAPAPGTSSFGETNITASTTNNILLDLANFNLFRVRMLTNIHVTFTNATSLTRRAQVYFQQDTNGARLLNSWDVAGGLLQTNANMQPTTNSSALDMLEVMPGFFTTNLLAWWPQNFQPRVAFTNALAGPVDIAFVSYSTNSFSSTSTTLDLPAGTQAGDFLLFLTATDSANSVTNTPAGYTLSESNQLALAGFAAFWKVADGGEDPTQTFDFSATEAGSSMLLCFRNANASSPFDTDSVNSQTATSLTTPAITPSANNSMLIGVVWNDPSAAPVFTEVSGFPLLGTAVRNANGAIAVATRLQTTATSEGVQITTDTSAGYGIYTISIKK
jgi:hypothetical protein